MMEFEYKADDDLDEDEEEGSSWTYGGRAAGVFLIDASALMFESSSDEEDTPFSRAVKVRFRQSSAQVLTHTHTKKKIQL